VQQVARSGMLIAVIRLGRLQMGEPIQSGSHQYPGDSALTKAQRLRDLAVSLALAPELDHATRQVFRGGMWATPGTRGTTPKARLSLNLVATKPLVSRSGADSQCLRSLSGPEAFFSDSTHEKQSTMDS